MNSKQKLLSKLPAVDRILLNDDIISLINKNGKNAVILAIRQVLEELRVEILKGVPPPAFDDICIRVSYYVKGASEKKLKKVYNATGVVIHTNLGRSPFSTDMLKNSFEVLNGYCNLEFDLEEASRGSRNAHLTDMLTFLTGAEDVLIVNNAAAAVMLTLRTFAKSKEVIISRGELIEIGGSFRIPDIMAASDCIMREVGTTNKTRPSDYENAINDHTGLLFKAHQSNYIIKGFTEEVGLEKLVEIGKKNNTPVFYDLGSGLLHDFEHPVLKDEPCVKTSLASGVDLICFSGDKLLGGPQAGIIAGKKAFIDKLKKEPMLRALRVCKVTLALMETTCKYFITQTHKKHNQFYKYIFRSPKDLHKAALKLEKLLTDNNIPACVIKSDGQFGGGTLPDRYIESYAVKLDVNFPATRRADFSEKMYKALLKHQTPVVGFLKKGRLYFDVLALSDGAIKHASKAIIEVYNNIFST